MKLHATLPALLLVAASSWSFSAYAATDAEKSPATDAKADKPVAMEMKPGSHMKEKTGMEQPASSSAGEKSAKPKAGKDKSKHFHPRDGK